MSKYKSTTVYTSNEAEEYEVELVYKNGLLRGMLGLEPVKETYVRSGGTCWYEKGDWKEGRN